MTSDKVGQFFNRFSADQHLQWPLPNCHWSSIVYVTQQQRIRGRDASGGRGEGSRCDVTASGPAMNGTTALQGNEAGGLKGLSWAKGLKGRSLTSLKVKVFQSKYVAYTDIMLNLI